MIQVVYQLFNLFGLNKKVLALFSEKEPDQSTLPDYVKVSSNRFYEIKSNIDNNKGLMTRVKDTSGKIITIDVKDTSNLMYQISKNETTYDEVKMIFNNKISSAVDKIALTNPTNNKTKLLKIFFGIREVLIREFYGVEIVDGKYESVKLKNKVDDEQSELETQRQMPSELGCLLFLQRWKRTKIWKEKTKIWLTTTHYRYA